jgi:hypothetical protein
MLNTTIIRYNTWLDSTAARVKYGGPLPMSLYCLKRSPQHIERLANHK